MNNKEKYKKMKKDIDFMYKEEYEKWKEEVDSVFLMITLVVGVMIGLMLSMVV